MIKNYFKIAFRNLIKRKYYTAINILGLSLGITCSIFLYLFISYHLSFDSYHKNASRTYRVLNEVFFDKPVYEKGASMGSPVALWVINKWINNFAYRIHIEWWVFAIAGLFSVFIALATISFQAIKAAIANPVTCLRTE
jgi:hypothetical protein